MFPQSKIRQLIKAHFFNSSVNLFRQLYRTILVVSLTIPLLGIGASPIQAKATKTPKAGITAGNAYDVIALVNQLRASNGLAPFQTNAALMASAQSHSQYQANIGSTTHTGSGGSDVKSRALAAGYGAGANVSVIENIYGGMGATPQRAVTWWQGDGPHLNTMLSTRHTDAGAGIAVSSSGVVFITLDVGSVVGGSAPPVSQTTPVVGSTPGALPAASTGVVFNPVLIASPNPDGSIIHLVQAGQTLWTIAATYKIALPDLLRLNGFTENSLIYPGDKLLIKPAGLVTPTLRATGTPEPETTVPKNDLDKAANFGSGYEITPSPSALPAQGSNPPAAAVSVQKSALQAEGSRTTILLIIVIAFLLVGGAALVLTGNVIRRLD